MMDEGKDNLEALLARISAGELDELTPEQIDALEDYLNESPAAAELLGTVMPSFVEGAEADTALPSDGEWEQVWRGVEAGQSSEADDVKTAASIVRGRRLGAAWRSAAALAACAALMLILRLGPKSADAGWDMKLSDHVVVHDLEICDDGSGFIAFDDEGGAVIWVFEGEESQEGAS